MATRKTAPVWLTVVAMMVCAAAASDAQPTQPQPREVRVADEVAVVLPDRWVVTEQLRDSLNVVRRGDGRIHDADLLIAIERRFDHADALQRLVEIAAEQPEPARATVIAGWPAIERVYRDPVPTTAEREVEKAYTPSQETLWVTTAVAADDLVIRFETMLRPGASPAIVEEALALGRAVRPRKRGNADVTRREVEQLERLLAVRPPQPPDPPKDERPGGGAPASGDAARKSTVGVPVNARGGLGEIEVATSADGQNVVVAANPGYAFSTDGGATFTAAAGGTPAPFPRDGDPSLAVGATGTFYYAFIGFPNGTAAAGGVTGCSNSVSVSADNGQTFNWRSHAVLCTNTGTICFPDQEHIAADRSGTTPAGNDQVYLVWRNFTSATAPTCNALASGAVTPRITCSSDSGNSWPTTVNLTGGDFPRVSVGQDGFVYVAYRQGGNMMLDKYSSCTAGLARQVGFPRTVSAFTMVTCPMPGLDRCNDGNILSSPTAAVDDLDPNHVYYAFATSTVAGTNENVVVADSTDGGVTFPRSVVLNDAVNGRRFAPWVSTYGGVAYVSWYDRSMAAATNDMTRFFSGSASVRGNALVRGPQIDVSQATDPQCASGWPCGTRAAGDSDTCTTQPQLAGRCRTAAGGGSQTACDFSAGGCPAGETCQTSSGCPKYGDYNGNAARNGRFYVAWASATPPPGVVAPGAGINVYADALLTPSNFFVRDWTTNATTRDRGEEPSTNPVFYLTSDVWGQTTSAPYAAVNDWVQGDLARRGAGSLGDNFAFVRVSRRAAAAPTAPPVTVNAQFYTADYGLGTPFVTVGAPQPLTFNAGDMTRTLASGLPWHVDATASTHVCLAVEINHADDPLALPSIAGNSPGPADPLITIDNNKAQRNIDTVPGTSGSSGLSGYALIQNSADHARIIDVLWEVPENFCDRLGRVRGSLGGSPFELTGCRGRISTDRLLPGAHRWLELTFDRFEAREGEVLPIFFSEPGPGPAGASTGFVLAARGESPAGLAAENAAEHVFTFTRAAKLGIDEANDALKGFEALRRNNRDRLDPRQYRARLAANAQAILRVASAVDRRAPKAGLRLREKAAAFQRALRGNRFEAVAAAHTSLLRAIDAGLTDSRLSAAGNVSTLIRWEKALLEKLAGDEGRKATADAARLLAMADTNQAAKLYPEHVEVAMPALRAAVNRTGNEAADRELNMLALSVLGGSGIPEAHWRVLAALSAAAGQ